jgi:predicted dithiol-disulfide oxidoreductase (DUF899 family)
MNPTIVNREEWTAQRRALLAREKEFTRLSDQLARDRQALPWVRVDKDYVFDSATGPRTLADLFEERSQLLVQHFMLGPGWAQGCPSCSFMADHTDAMNVHLKQRGIAIVAVSRAPLAEIAPFRRRMGWRFEWVSSHGSDFNFDFGVSFTPQQMERGEVPYNYRVGSFPVEEAPGVSAFARNAAGEIFHTYSTYGRGVEVMMGTYRMLDLAPFGRGERDVPNKMEWVRHHDRYENTAPSASCCHA